MMTFEMTCLAWVLALAVLQILLAATVKTAQCGLGWSMSARDQAPAPISPLAARLTRAQANLFETLPIFIGAVLIVSMTGKTSDMTHWGALLYLIGRVVYVPLYAAGVPVVRTLVWTVSLVGLLMVVAATLM